MKAIVGTLCLTLLLGVLGIPASGWGDRAAAAPPMQPAATPAPDQEQAAVPLDAGLPIRFNHVSMEQGLSALEVWSILRDQRGFLWFGTIDGLDRYDGYTVKSFRHDPANPTSLSENRIRTLYEDRAGNLWIGTWTGGLNRFDPKTETFTSFRHDPANPDSVSSDSAYAILEDRAGKLWLGTRGGGLEHFDPKTGTFSHYRHDPAQPNSLVDDNIFALWEEDDGTLWIGTAGGLDHFDPNTGNFTHYRNNPEDPTSLSHDAIRALYEDSSGTLWVGTWGGGLNRLDRTTGTFAHYQNDPNDPLSLSNDAVFAIQQDDSGMLWIGTLGGGLSRLDPQSGTFRRFQRDDTNPSGFGATEVYNLLESAGMMWFATANGVFSVDLQPKPFHTIQHHPDDANSLAASEIDSVYEDPQGILWVSTADTGLNRIDRATGQITRIQHDPSDPNTVSANDIWDIAQNRGGKLWLAIFSSGLDSLDPKTQQTVHYRHDPNDASSLGSDHPYTVLVDHTGIVWVGTWDAGLDAVDPATGIFSHFPHDPASPTSLSDNSVTTLFEDRNGELWVGTLAGGLNRFDRATHTFTHYQSEPDNPQSLPSNTVYSVLLDRAGTLWVGTSAGLARLNPATGEATIYGRKNGMHSDTICAILEDAQGRLWISTVNGLARFDPRTATFRNYDTYDGLPGDGFELGVGFQSPSGELFFGATNGLLAFDPDQIRDDPTAPSVVITDFLLANKPVAIGAGSVLPQAIDETDALTLTYRDRVISFEFAALSYAVPQKNRYRYMLQGMDEGWTEVGSDRRFVTYTNLDPGNYVFRVLGSNDDGVWNEKGASLALTVTPPWWETIWFRLVAILLLLGLLVGGFIWQRLNALRQQHRLEAMVVERTRELQDARTQINTLFDQSPLGICVSDPHGKILGANRAMQRITGFAEDELLRLNVGTFYAVTKQRVALREQLFTTGALQDYGIQLRRRDGTIFYANLNLSRLILAGEEVWLGIIDDITEQVESREALTTLHHISSQLASIADLETMLNHAFQQLQSIVDFQRAALILVDDENELLTIHTYLLPALPQSSTPDLIARQVPVSSWPALHTVLHGGETTYIPDLQADPAMQAELDQIVAEWWAAVVRGVRSWLSVPLRIGERTFGSLNILHDQPHHFEKSDIELARTFANHLAVFIDNIRLNEQARQAATANERSHIARELHDSVTQTLFTASVIAETTPRIWNNDRNLARQNMERLSVLIRGALAEMRSLLIELRTGAAPDKPLGELLNTLAEATRARSNVAVSLNIHGEWNPPTAVLLALYRITQEALNNVVKHAEATAVDVALFTQPERVELRIRDDGRGFDPSVTPADHMGLGIMAERAQMIGAILEVESQPRRGTEVSVTWQNLAEETASHA